MSTANYDTFAEAYNSDNENNAWNAYYERPAILSMIGDVERLRVLDAGCGGGAHAAELVSRGAVMTGIDNSPGLLEVAARRLDGQARLLLADLNEPIPFADASFDVVMSSLVMHYLPDWSIPLAEFRRVLCDRGRLVFSTHHPFMDHELSGNENYFETYSFEERWERGGRAATMRFWHRSLHTIVDELKKAGFSIEAVEEPPPDPRARSLFPEAYHSLSTKPRFLFISATKGPGRTD